MSDNFGMAELNRKEKPIYPLRSCFGREKKTNFYAFAFKKEANKWNK